MRAYVQTGIIICALTMVAGSRDARGQGVASSVAQGISDIPALQSFADVPALPTTVAQAFSRYGPITPTSDKETTAKGDVAGEPLRKRIKGWMAPIEAAMRGVAAGPSSADYAAMMRGGGRMTAAAGQAMGRILQVAGPMTMDFSKTVQTFGLTTLPALEAPYERKLDQLFKEYNPRINRCIETSCGDDPKAEYDAAVNAAANDFLRSVAPAYDDYRNHLHEIAAQGQAAIDGATKSLGAPVPPMLKTQMAAVKQNELNALLASLTAEEDIYTYVLSKAVWPNGMKP